MGLGPKGRAHSARLARVGTMLANVSPWLPWLASLRLWAQATPAAQSRTGLAAATAFAVLGRTTHAGPARRAAVHVTALKWPAAQNECCQQWVALSGTRWNGCTTASGGLSAHRLDPKHGALHHFSVTDARALQRGAEAAQSRLCFDTETTPNCLVTYPGHDATTDTVSGARLRRGSSALLNQDITGDLNVLSYVCP